MLGHMIAYQRGRVFISALSQPFLIHMAIGLFLLLVGFTDYCVGDTNVEKVKNRRCWWESRTPRRRVFQFVAETAGGL